MNQTQKLYSKWKIAIGLGAVALMLTNKETKQSSSSRLSYWRNLTLQNWVFSNMNRYFNYNINTCADGLFQNRTYDPTFKTDVYVWGNGVIRNNEMDYSNYVPKKIKNFSEENSPVVISVKFGLYHEAYLDTQGKIHICKKYQLPSKKVEGQDDGLRSGFQLLEVEGEQIIEIQFTKNRLFGLSSSGKVYIWIITKNEPKLVLDSADAIDEMFSQGSTDETTGVIDPTPYQIRELYNITSIKTGEDHFLALDDEGVVWAMGEDKYGQWGQYHDNRPIVPPFRDVRIGKPTRVNVKDKIVKIAWGTRHSLAITPTGRLYAWGYNHQVQISHGEDMAASTTQKLVIFEPTTINKEIDSQRVTHADGGSDFSIIIAEDSKGEQQFWSTGNNLRGQLGINMTTHFHDMVTMYFEDEPIEPVKFKFLTCGRRHSLLALERGGLFIWGDNEYGQIGNK